MGTAWHSVSKMGNGLRRISSYFKRIERTTLPTLKVCSDTGHDSFRDGGIMASTGTMTAPLIRRLTIERFRGIKRLEWYPAQGVNVILGGGDVGKTTILDAIALLLNPTNTMLLSDADYWRREVENGFCIEAVDVLAGDLRDQPADEKRMALGMGWQGPQTSRYR